MRHLCFEMIARTTLEKIGEVVAKIIKAVSNWTFWDWLKLAGAALVGFLALKTLLNWFSKGKNPLQAVADGFGFLEKAVGWAVLILAFAAFVKVLTEFVECMKSADWEDIVKSLLMLGGAFAELFLAAGGLMYLSTALGVAAPTIAATGAVVGAFALFTKALSDFIECMKSADWEDIVKSLLMLGGAFAELVLAAGGLMVIASALGALAPQMAALALVIASFAPLIASLSMFVEAMKGLTTEDVLNGLLFLAGALTAVAIAIGVVLVVLSAAIASGVGALAILALAGLMSVMSLVILSLAVFVKALGEAGAGIKLICEGVANGIVTIMQPILTFIENVIGQITELASIIAKEIGETIRTNIKVTGEVILGIIDSLVNIIPRLLRAITDFLGNIGPSIERTADSIMRTVTRIINFVASAIEYLINLVVGGMNGIISAVNSLSQYVGLNLPMVAGVAIPRFVPQYATGTNYVPNDGLAYLHQGEAVIPKKYNTPYEQGALSNEEKVYMQQMLSTMRSLDGTMKRGIPVNGQFVQRGSDLVAVVNKTKSQIGADLLSNVSYAR